MTGVGVTKPRRLAAFNCWSKYHHDIINPIYEAEIAKEKPASSHLAAMRSRITKQLFEALPKEEQIEWEQKAKDDHKTAVEEWEALSNPGRATEPAKIQR